MIDLVTDMGGNAAYHILQIVIGCCIASFGLPYFKKINPENIYGVISMLIVPVIGVLLPLDSFGVIPVASMMIALRFPAYMALQLFVSNSLFNLLIPFNEAGFRMWPDSGRMVLAVLIGISVGVLVKRLKINTDSILRLSVMKETDKKRKAVAGVISETAQFIYTSGIYIILAAVAEVLLGTYWREPLKAWFYSSPLGYFFARELTQLNLFNVFFLLALSLAGNLLNPVKLAAAAVILRSKGIVLYYFYIGTWALLLSVSLFI